MQAALEGLQSDIISATSETSSNVYTINNDANMALPENACLIMRGGDGSALLEGYLCLITDAVNGSYFQFRTFKDGTLTDTSVVVGAKNTIADVDAYMSFYAGDGANSKLATIKLRGEDGYLLYTADQHYFIGPVNIQNNLTVGGDTFFAGDVNMTGPLTIEDLDVNGHVISDLLPFPSGTYMIGDSTHEWKDGYFGDIHMSGEVYSDSLHVTGDSFLNDLDVSDLLTTEDLHVDGNVTSDLMPLPSGTQSLGDSAHEWKDGYFGDIHMSGEVYSNSLHVTGDSFLNVLNTSGQVTASGPVRLLSNAVIDGYLYVNGNVVLGDSSLDSIDFTGTITSDLLPTNNTYYVGGPANRWVDGYFDFFTPTHYDPVGSNWSLEGHLKGIDEALGNVMVAPPRGVYVVTAGEGTSNTVDSSRAADQGSTIDVSGLDDAVFMNYVFVYRNGQLLYNDDASRVGTGSVKNDVSRKSGELKTLLFASDLRKGDIIQIVDMR